VRRRHGVGGTPVYFGRRRPPAGPKIGGGAAWAAKRICFKDFPKISFYRENFMMTLF